MRGRYKDRIEGEKNSKVSWLGIRDSNWIFNPDETKDDIVRDIQAIRELLDEDS